MPTDLELGWAAGLFEGEGCLTISSGTIPRAKLRSTDEEVVRQFHRIVGFGRVREEPYFLKNGHKMQWEWYALKREVPDVIALLYPLLGERRRARADELLALYKEGT